MTRQRFVLVGDAFATKPDYCGRSRKSAKGRKRQLPTLHLAPKLNGAVRMPTQNIHPQMTRHLTHFLAALDLFAIVLCVVAPNTTKLVATKVAGWLSDCSSLPQRRPIRRPKLYDSIQEGSRVPRGRRPAMQERRPTADSATPVAAM